MEDALDEYSLEAIGQEHPVAVAMFVPFAIARLQRDPTGTDRGASPMSDPSTTAFDRQGLDEAFAADEVHKSNLILEARLLEARQQLDEAAQKFAQAAEQEERLSNHCAKLGLSDRASLHLYSAASCWARAGNFYRAIALSEDLLRRADMSESLRQRIQDYAHALRSRRAQWQTGLPQLAAPAGV